MLSVTFTAPLSAFAQSPLAAATQRAGSRPAVSMVESTKTNKEQTRSTRRASSATLENVSYLNF